MTFQSQALRSDLLSLDIPMGDGGIDLDFGFGEEMPQVVLHNFQQTKNLNLTSGDEIVCRLRQRLRHRELNQLAALK